MSDITNEKIKELFKTYGTDQITLLVTLSLLTGKPINEVASTFTATRQHVQQVVYGIRD